MHQKTIASLIYIRRINTCRIDVGKCSFIATTIVTKQIYTGLILASLVRYIAFIDGYFRISNEGYDDDYDGNNKIWKIKLILLTAVVKAVILILAEVMLITISVLTTMIVRIISNCNHTEKC